MFYNKIRHLIELSGIAENAQESTAENAFLNGIHRELLMAIKSSPVILDLQAKVNFANRYWTARNQGIDLYEQVLPAKLKDKIPRTTIPNVAEMKIPITQAPIQGDDKMDKLIDAMSKVTAHVHDLDQRMTAKTQKVQRFYHADDRNYNNNYRYDGNGGYRDNTNQDSFRPSRIEQRPPSTGSNNVPMGNRSRSPGGNCMVCDNPGHWVKDCPFVFEARKLKESNLSKNSTSANLVEFQVQEIFDGDEEDSMVAQSFYPAQKKDKERRAPYSKTARNNTTRKPPTPAPEPEEDDEEDELTDPRFNRQVEEIINQDTPMSESPTRESRRRLVKHKTYKYDAWAALMDEPARLILRSERSTP